MSVRISLHRISSSIKLTFALLATLSLVAYTPLSAYALDAASSDTTTSCAPDPTGAGVSRPNGADAATYTYNCAGYYENQYFTYNPVTGNYRNKTEPTYTYNPVTLKYDYPVWIYNAPTNSFVAVTNSIAIPPSGATVVGAPVSPAVATTAPATTANQSISNTGSNSNNQIANDGSGGTATIAGTGSSSNNLIDATGKDRLTGNFTTVATVNNLLNSQAASGNVLLTQNTTAGNATSGDVSNTSSTMTELTVSN